MGAQPSPQSSDPITHLYDALKHEMQQVNSVIVARLETAALPLIKDVGHHVIAAGGKRLRPLLTLAAHSLFSPVSEKTILLAAAVEMIHTATLLHDDVIDEADQRRGSQAAHTVWGNATSVLVGDFLFSKAFELMVESDNLSVLGCLSRAAATIAEGEILQLQHSYTPMLDLAIYLDIVHAKTAALFAAACKSGALMGGASKDNAEISYNFGLSLGIAFQMIDDVLDYMPSALTGKKSGTDFAEGKTTLPLILAQQKNILPAPVFISSESGVGFDVVQRVLRDHHIFEECRAFAGTYTQQAKYHLENLPKTQIRDDLYALIDYSNERCY